jgi:hypothetical protein
VNFVAHPKGRTLVEIQDHGKEDSDRFYVPIPYPEMRRRWGKKGKYNELIGCLMCWEKEKVESFRKEINGIIEDYE